MKKILFSSIFTLALVSCAEKKVDKVETEMSSGSLPKLVKIDSAQSDINVDSTDKIKSTLSIVKDDIKRVEEVVVKKPDSPIEEEEVLSKREVISAPEINSKGEVPLGMVISFNHLKFNEILQKHVSDKGVVNYESLKIDAKKLKSYLAMLKEVQPVSTWSRNKKLAYYINIYNASTLQLIVEHYPLKSIMDIDKAWDLQIVEIGEKMYTLNQIENDIIRPTFKDARIHFAINCAAVSCPKLSNVAFSENNVEILLKANTERFLNDKQIGLSIVDQSVELSSIFDWYAVDFGGKENLLKWITENSTQNLDGKILKGFFSYNWDLNNK